MKLARRFAGALALWLVAGAAMAGPVVKLDPAVQKRLGVATQPLSAAHRTAQAAAFARVLDPVPLATLDSDIAAAASALSASQAEAVRARRLNAADQTVSARAAEAAAAQARADAAKLNLLRRRVGLEWGPALARLSDAQRARLIAEIAAGRAALVRIDSAGGLASTRGAATLDLGQGQVAQAAILGPTRSSDPRLQSTGLLALVRGPAALRLGAGTVVPAKLATGAQASGVVIPRSALMRTGGATFAYVRSGAGVFERRQVIAPVADADGLFVATGFRPGEAVVTAGAAKIFAAEAGPAKGD